MQAQSNVDTVTRVDIQFCYICNYRIKVFRTEGDVQRMKSDPETVNRCKADFLSTESLEILPFLCEKEDCLRAYQRLPDTHYKEVEVVLNEAVPCFSGSLYDFPEYAGVAVVRRDPERGYKLNTGYCLDNITIVESFFQEWLFFGIGQHILGRYFQRSEYISAGAQTKPTVSLRPLVTAILRWMPSASGRSTTISLRPLVTAISRWMPSASGQSATKLEEINEHKALLELVCRLLRDSKVLDFSEDLRHFIAYASELISRALSYLYPEIKFESFHEFWPLSRKRDLLASGWCPREAEVFAESSSLLAPRSLFCGISRKDLRPEHVACTSSDCKESREVSRKHSGPRHRKDCPDERSCKAISVDDEQMKVMCDGLATSRFSVFTIGVDDAGIAQSLKIAPHTTDMKYVAISHVWAHGLGNEDDNSLHQCQLSYLHQRILNINSIFSDKTDNSPLYLWLDTLCCPVESRGGRRARDNAIKLMRATYATATIVLALDMEWEHLKLAELSVLEVVAHTLSASWVWRLWTLQEGAFPKELWLQFGDRQLSAHTLFLALRDVARSRNVRDRIAANQLVTSFVTLRVLCGRFVFGNREQEILTLLLAVEKRSVMREKDEPFCVATLLSLDPTTILSADDVITRKQRFWQLMSDAELIPRGICFHLGPSLGPERYSWAPLTLMRPSASVSFRASDPDKVTLTEWGLRIRGSGILLKSAVSLSGPDDSHGNSAQDPVTRYREWIRENTTAIRGLDNEWMGMMKATTHWSLDDPTVDSPSQVLSEANKSFAVIRQYISSAPGIGLNGQSVLVEVKGWSGGGMQCIRRTPVGLHLLNAPEPRVELWSSSTAMVERSFDETQLWYLL